VLPDKFVDELPAVLTDAPPLPGEEARYAQVLALLAAARDDPKLKQPLRTARRKRTRKLVKPLFQFRNYGQQLPHNWSTISNESAFGNGLLYAHCGREVQHPRQFAERDKILLPGPRRERRQAQQRQSATP